MNQPASNVTLKHPTGPWWTIYGSAGEIVQQIGQVFPHLTQNAQASDFPMIVAQASAEWAQLVGSTGSTPNGSQGGGSQNFNQGNGGGFGGNQNSGGNGFGGGGNQGGGYNNGGGGGGSQQGGGTPEPTHVPRPHCLHGEMVWRSGIGKQSNKAYAMWTCTSNDRNNQCKPEFPPR